MEALHDPDHALVVACQQAVGFAGDDSFRRLHDRHKDVVHRVCLRITGDAGEALDAAQDAFLLAFRGIRGFRFASRFSRWLCCIAAHASFERLRRRHPPPVFSELDLLDFELALPADQTGAAARSERRDLVRRALRRLPPHLSEILVLRYFEGLSYEELAARLEIAIGSVRSRLHRAHAALGQRMLALARDLGTET